MNVWLIKAEPYPFIPGASLMRIGTLAQTLSEKGHQVLWWGSSFSHSHKIFISEPDEIKQISPNLRIRLLGGPGYKKNISLKRYIHTRALARRFAELAPKEQPPDVIVCCLPSHEECYEAVKYAKARNIPIYIDIRDLWPDILIAGIPSFLKPFGRLLLGGDIRRTRYALKNATGIIGISESYLNFGLKYAGRARRNTDAIFYLGAPELEPMPPDAEIKYPWVSQLKGKTVFGFIGSFGNTYDIDIIVRAAKYFSDAGNTDFHFLVGGSGDDFDSIKAKAEGLTNITLTGWLQKEGINVLLRSSHVGLATYAKNAPQSLPNKPFQYFSAGLPIITSLDTDCKSLLYNNNLGVYYQADNLDNFISSVSSFASIKKDNKINTRILELFNIYYSYKVIYSHYASFIVSNNLK